MYIRDTLGHHDDIIKWKHFPHNWPFRSPVDSPHTGALMFSLIYAWANNQDPGDLRCHLAHYDVTVMMTHWCPHTSWCQDISRYSADKNVRNIFFQVSQAINDSYNDLKKAVTQNATMSSRTWSALFQVTAWHQTGELSMWYSDGLVQERLTPLLFANTIELCLSCIKTHPYLAWFFRVAAMLRWHWGNHMI